MKTNGNKAIGGKFKKFMSDLSSHPNPVSEPDQNPNPDLELDLDSASELDSVLLEDILPDPAWPDPTWLADSDRLIFASAERTRISSIEREGRKVWIKRYDVEQPCLGRRLHARFSYLLPLPFLRAAPLRPCEDMVMQEVRKTYGFYQAGLPVAPILAISGCAMMIDDVGETVAERLKYLRDRDAIAHDNLLIQCAEALGQAHAHDLVHGRPHPRDMFLVEERLGFFDFEEEPEAAMSLAQAQARDAWLLFFQISSQALDKERTCPAAFTAWRRFITLESLHCLQELVRFFRFCVLPLKIAKPIWLGEDGKRMLQAMEFFVSHLGLKEK